MAHPHASHLCDSSHHYLSPFSITTIQEKWPSRIQDLLEVSVADGDGLSGYMFYVYILLFIGLYTTESHLHLFEISSNSV